MAEQALILAGAAPDTGNLGVSALCLSVLGALRDRLPDADVVVLDHGRGRGPLALFPGATRRGAVWSKRLHRPESMQAAMLADRARLVPHPLRSLFSRVAAVLDISGGDSFTDLYGPWRFDSVCAPKELALRRRTPLVLLPQTYGPFASPESRARAARIVRGAALAYARDARSFDILRDLLSDAFDPQRHRVGVDVAFLLPVQRPDDPAVREIEPTLERAPVGLNVSGLIWNDPAAARDRFKFKADYREALVEFAVRALGECDAPLLLVPHVVTPPGHYESDIDAARALRDAVDARSPALAERVVVAPALNDPRAAKWIISRCSWFCGTRMHATIAGLSSGVATAAVSYSPKTLGVFETCAMGAHVVDPTSLDTAQVVDGMLASLRARDDARATLARTLPGVLATARAQFDHVASAIPAPALSP